MTADNIRRNLGRSIKTLFEAAAGAVNDTSYKSIVTTNMWVGNPKVQKKARSAVAAIDLSTKSYLRLAERTGAFARALNVAAENDILVYPDEEDGTPEDLESGFLKLSDDLEIIRESLVAAVYVPGLGQESDFADKPKNLVKLAEAQVELTDAILSYRQMRRRIGADTDPAGPA